MKAKCYLLVIASACLLAVSPAVCSAVEIADTDFSNWSVLYDDHSAIIHTNFSSSVQQVTGSNNTMTFTVIKEAVTDGTSWVFVEGAFFEGDSYTPSTDGAILNVDISFKADRIDDGNWVVYNPALYQNGTCYIYHEGVNWYDGSADGTYTQFEATGLGAGFWAEEAIDGSFIPYYDSKPDFSATGGEIKFGIVVRAGSSATYQRTFPTSFDDFTVTIHKMNEADGIYVEEFGNVADVMSVANCEGFDFKDYVLPNPEVTAGTRASAASPFTGFVTPSSDYTTLDPLPKPVGVLVNAYWINDPVNVLFKDGSSTRVYSPLYGIREPYAGYSRLDISFVDPNNTTDWTNPLAGEVSHVGFVLESVANGSIEVEFYDARGNLIVCAERFLPSGTGEISFVSKDSTGNPVPKIHRVVFTGRPGYDLQDYWSLGSTVGTPTYEVGLAYANLTIVPPCPTADLTGDCHVNIDDLAVLASQWLN